MSVSQRVLSLLPAATEIVCALGARDRLVGRSHECDFPAGVRTLPSCTNPRFDVAGASGEIHRQVTAQFKASSGPLYSLNSPLIRDLCPDVILTQAQCEVCAVSLAEVGQVAAKLFRPPKIVALSPVRLADLWSDFTSIAASLALEDRAKETVRALKNRCVDILMKTALMTNRPTVACVEWLDPLMASGNWVPELVVFAGGVNLFGKAGEHSSWMKWEEIVARNPDVLVLMPCGFDIARTRRELGALASRPGWKQLRAVKSSRVVIADGGQFFNRPGPRLVNSLEILAEVLHPGVFPFGYEGRGWEFARM
ncbi:MAG: cobalamin-binding protein [Verrucomicrobia bacterium]|nr:cobalamin-binding protein [Verrucomicrobiota bacterium]